VKPPGTPETRILEALSRFDQLTAEQLARHLSYSFRYTQTKCKMLTEGKYLQRLTLPKRTHGGSVPYVYTLGRKGRQYLSRIAEDDTLGVKKRYRPSEEQARLHTLATNEVLLKLLKQTKDDPSLSLARFIQDREFHNEPILVPIPERSKTATVSLIPDLWLEVRQMVGGKAYT
jgi:Replication-relaxation